MTPRNSVVAALLALSMAVAAAGCSGDSTARGDSSPSASPTSSPSIPAAPSPTDTAEAADTAEATPAPPKLPKPADTPAGRRAFARYVAGTWGYALRTNDPQPLLSLSQKKKACGGCAQLRSELRKRKKQGWYVDFPGVKVKKVDLVNTGDTTNADMSVAIPESDSYNEDGTYRSTNPAHRKGTFEVKMRYRTSGYELVAFRVS